MNAVPALFMDKTTTHVARVAACVVLYNSESQVLHNINTYVDQVKTIYAIDNSDIPDDKLVALLRKTNNVNYHWMNGNKGIAAALNKAAQLAIDSAYGYLLLMDDDSQLTEDTVTSMMSYIDQRGNRDLIGTVTAQSDPNLRGISVQQVWYAITSGSLLNLKAYQECGPFMEDLFIDGVDHEYCYRLKKAHYEVVILNYVFMSHRMGVPEKVTLFNKVIYKWSSHSPLRSYYLVRNFLFILNQYKTVVPSGIKREVYYGVLKACLLDLVLGANKWQRIRYIGKAILDYKNNKLGRLSQLIN